MCGRLVNAYCSRLQSLGVSYSAEECYRAFCRAGMEKWICFFVVMAAADLSAELMNYLHDQVSAVTCVVVVRLFLLILPPTKTTTTSPPQPSWAPYSSLRVCIFI